MVKINIYANNKLIPHEIIKKWELERLKNVTIFLSKLLNIECKNLNQKEEKDFDQIKNNLVDLKFTIGDEIRNKLKLILNISHFITKIINFLSFGKRKYSIVEIVINNINLEPIEFSDRLNHIMLKNDKKYSKLRIMACPDHYLILSTSENKQEVIETTGGSPFPSQFYITYGDEEGLQSKKDPTYDIQLTGAARDRNGTTIGGVRHQIKKEKNGLRVKLLVEFPVLVLNKMIREHQLHLMCEFSNWIKDIINDSNFN